MSHYTDFIEELPKRSLKLLRYFDLEKKQPGSNEVTLLISIAMPVFVISTEIIKKNDGKDHPELYMKLNKSVNENPIFKDAINEWSYEHTYRNYYEIDSLLYPEVFQSTSELNPLSKLTQIRNALSHGGIKFTRGRNNEIDKILFISEKRKISEDKSSINDGYHLNLISIGNFKTLLTNWCKFLQNEKVEYCLTVLQDAA